MRAAWPSVLLALFCLSPAATAQAPADPAPPPSLSAPLPTAPQSDVDASTPPAGLSLTGEFLFLRPDREGLGVAVVSGTSGGMTSQSLESLSWDGTPGFRLGAGYRLPESDMDLAATFTYLHARTQRTIDAPDGGSLQGTLATVGAARDAASADSDAALSYAVLDLDAGRSAALGDSLDVRAFAGVRLASINQTLKSIYSGGALGDESDYVNGPIRFYGAGVTGGAEATWSFYRGWGLYGRGRLGLLSGSFDGHRTETLGTALIDDESVRYYPVVPVAEVGAGVCYRGERLLFSAGYEMTDWLNMAAGVGGVAPGGDLTQRPRGDITLEALALRLGYSF